MGKIASFKVDHMRLVPGIYISRTDEVNGSFITTFDIRVKRPNFEDAMSPEISHTIEHLGATFLRNAEGHKDSIIYFGPMGCLTGFYLVYSSDTQITVLSVQFREIVKLILAMMRFVVTYGGTLESVGFDAESCGNYKLNDLAGARNVCANFLTLDDALGALRFEYPTSENAPDIATSTSINGDDALNKELIRARRNRRDVQVNYEKLNRDFKSFISTYSDLTDDEYFALLIDSIKSLKNLPPKKEKDIEDSEKQRFLELAFAIKDETTKEEQEETESERPKIFSQITKKKKTKKKQVEDGKVIQQNVLF